MVVVNVTPTTCPAKNNLSNPVTSTNGGTGNTASATLNVGCVDLAVAKSHSATFTQGDTARTYTITVSNVGVQASSGLVTVTDSLPAGLTARAIVGPGWSCDLGTLVCTRSDSLNPNGASYPDITLTVSVNCDAAASVTNTVQVTGGNDLVNANDTAGDPTTINPDTTPPVITCPGSIVTFTTPGQNGAFLTPGPAGATDECGATVTGARSDGKALNALYPVGITMITWTAKDPNGNSSSCTQTILVLVHSGGGYHGGPVGPHKKKP
jgi:uncharacterized repeat protein (TIGR01451 family)